MDIYDHFEQHLKNRLGIDATSADKYKGYARNYDEWVKGKDRKSFLAKRKDKATANEFIEERYGSVEHPTNKVAVDAIGKFQEYLVNHGRLATAVDTVDMWKQRPPIMLAGGTLVLLATVFGVVTGIAFIAQNFASVPVESMPASGFNVIVAGFGLQNTDGSIVQSSVADDVSDLVLSEVQQSGVVDNIRSWRDRGVEHILSADAARRESQAAQLADTLGGDVVVYGIVRNEGLYNIFEPEFYLSAQFAALEPDFVGGVTFGEPIEYLQGSDDQLAASTEMQKRLSVLRLFLRGLSLYVTGEFTESRQAFENAIDLEPQGQKTLYVLSGNAALREQNIDRALELFDMVLAANPDYQRAVIGRGAALYALALQLAGDSPPEYNATLSLPVALECNDIVAPEPSEPQLLLDLAERCYHEASSLSDSQTSGDVDVKVALGLGQINLIRSLYRYANQWDEAETNLQFVVNSYGSSDPARQLRIRVFTAHANAYLGMRILAVENHTIASVQQAATYYSNAVDLLQNDANRSYNEPWFTEYWEQMTTLQWWVDSHLTMTPLPQPLPDDTPTPFSPQSYEVVCDSDLSTDDIRGHVFETVGQFRAYESPGDQASGRDRAVVPGELFMIVDNPVCISDGTVWLNVEIDWGRADRSGGVNGLAVGSSWVQSDALQSSSSQELQIPEHNFTTHVALDSDPAIHNEVEQLFFFGGGGGGFECRWDPWQNHFRWYDFGDGALQLADTVTFAPGERVEITVYRPDRSVYFQENVVAVMPGANCLGGEVGIEGFMFAHNDPVGKWEVVFRGESGMESEYSLYLTPNFSPRLYTDCVDGENTFVFDGFPALEPLTIELLEVESETDNSYETQVVARWEVDVDEQGQLVLTFPISLERSDDRYLLVKDIQGNAVFGNLSSYSVQRISPFSFSSCAEQS